jgi:hypothetical protein
VTNEEPENVATQDEGDRSTVIEILMFVISQSARAPERIRMNVKLAASVPVSFSAIRQRSELLANAIIAENVRMKIRGDFKGSIQAPGK